MPPAQSSTPASSTVIGDTAGRQKRDCLGTRGDASFRRRTFSPIVLYIPSMTLIAHSGVRGDALGCVERAETRVLSWNLLMRSGGFSFFSGGMSTLSLCSSVSVALRVSLRALAAMSFWPTLSLGVRLLWEPSAAPLSTGLRELSIAM